MSQAPRWNKYSDYLLAKYKQRVQKIPLDAKFSCPNRDGTISNSGCIFCNPYGSGTGLDKKGMSLNEQYNVWRSHYLEKNRAKLFIAYLQSFSNTYGTLEYFKSVLDEIKNFDHVDELVGLAIGTRPDCLDEEKLNCLLEFENFLKSHNKKAEIWLELGMQSSHDSSLKIINRGHDYACTVKAIEMASRLNLKTCVHLIAGLPNESHEDFMQSVEKACKLPISGIKFHSLYVCHNTELAKMYINEQYSPLSQDEYAKLLAKTLPKIPPHIIIHRTTSDPAANELLAPDWAWRSRDTNNKIYTELLNNNTWQGKEFKTNI